MEHSTSAVNWQPTNHAKAPGQTHPRRAGPRGPRRRHHRFFQWRAVARRVGEVPLRARAARRPRQRALPRGRASSAAIAGRLGEVLGSRVEAESRSCCDYQAKWAAEGRLPSSALDVPDPAHADPPRCCTTAGSPPTSCTRRRPHRHTASSSCPTLYLVTDEHAGGRRGAAEAVPRCSSRSSPASATRTTTSASAATPARSATCSASASRSSSRSCRDEHCRARRSGTGTLWSEDVTARRRRGARPVCRGPLAGRPAVTRRGTGTRGRLVPQHAARRRALGALARPGHRRRRRRSRRPRSRAASRPSVAAATGGSWLFLLNHTDAEQVVRGDRPRPRRRRVPSTARSALAAGARRRHQGGLRCSPASVAPPSSASSRTSGAVRVSDLVEQLGVSDMTIRRDIEQLADRRPRRARARRRPRRRRPQQRGARLHGQVRP